MRSSTLTGPLRSIPTWNRTRTCRLSESPRAIRYTIGHQTRADDWIRTSINRFTKPAPFCSATSASTSARSRTPSASFGGWLLSQEHTRVSVPRPCDRGTTAHSLLQFSVPVRFADELRPAFDPHVVVGVHRLPRRPDRLAAQRSCRPARGVRSALRLLQAMHASTQFSQLDTPPCARGTTWSIVSSSLPGWAPQYWQTYWSRLKMLRRLKVTAMVGSRS